MHSRMDACRTPSLLAPADDANDEAKVDMEGDGKDSAIDL
jgi:hypothetical protein